ncbi:MAG: hypothetical protein IPP35_01675 [Elusimicrobia bacterium]|nr:hypothetical protein [Elusimicrobiota bacterium]
MGIRLEFNFKLRRFRTKAVVFALAGGVWAATAGNLFADNLIPEGALYVTHSKILRSRFAAGLNYRTEDGSVSSGNLEYDLDVGLLTFFRRYVFKDPNVEKAQRLTTRLGFAYIPDLRDVENPADENRGIFEVTGRIPFGGSWLLADRNKGDFRWIDGVYSARYRNRVRLEHSMVRGSFKCTPYANAEAYYDFKADEWNRADMTLGAEFPWRWSTVLECYFTHYETRRGGDGQSWGFVFQKHLVTKPRGGT